MELKLTAYLLVDQGKENVIDKKEFDNTKDAIDWFKKSYKEITSGEPTADEIDYFKKFYDVIETYDKSYTWRLVPL